MAVDPHVAAKERTAYWVRVGAAALLLVILVTVVNVASHGAFLQPSNIVRVLRQITYNCVLGVGQTFVIITAGIDLSVGSLVALTGVVAARYANSVPLTGFLLIASTLVVAVGVGAAAGWVNALPVVKLNLPPFITTLAMLEMALGASFILAHGRPVGLNSTDFQNTGIGSFLGGVTNALHLPNVPIPVVWMLVIIAVASVLLTRTRFGRYVFAIGGNEEAARLAGINVGRVKTLVYVISGSCAAIVGFLYMALFSSGSPQTGTGDELLESIAAVVVGGTSLMGGRGSIVGTFFGALLIGVLYNAMNLLNVDSYLQKVVLGAVILLAVVLDELRKRYIAKG
ncbi:MAG: ABC transporter permease [Candidatus Eremiobacteraeota bacterium]|nr:ABC transporter permease [Candidatus Eremiobacteraeota bacterium]MBV8284673.1 ABC transporter permease [Candidatus Eremiobacteraeota bacterium]MBV8434948.1 ABC transporter permease [Candidatus Eremiobacteraeota bacterium]